MTSPHRSRWNFRVECVADVGAFMQLDFHSFRVSLLEFTMARPLEHLPDMTCSVLLQAADADAFRKGMLRMLEALRGGRQDLHVLIETLKPVNEYNGERDGPFADYQPALHKKIWMGLSFDQRLVLQYAMPYNGPKPLFGLKANVKGEPCVNAARSLAQGADPLLEVRDAEEGLVIARTRFGEEVFDRVPPRDRLRWGRDQWVFAIESKLVACPTCRGPISRKESKR